MRASIRRSWCINRAITTLLSAGLAGDQASASVDTTTEGLYGANSEQCVKIYSPTSGCLTRMGMNWVDICTVASYWCTLGLPRSVVASGVVDFASPGREAMG